MFLLVLSCFFRRRKQIPPPSPIALRLPSPSRGKGRGKGSLSTPLGRGKGVGALPLGGTGWATSSHFIRFFPQYLTKVLTICNLSADVSTQITILSLYQLAVVSLLDKCRVRSVPITLYPCESAISKPFSLTQTCNLRQWLLQLLLRRNNNRPLIQVINTDR